LALLFATILPPSALGAPYAYIPSQDSSDAVYVFDVGSNTPPAPIRLGNTPCGIIANPAGTRVYTANCFSDRISVIDTLSNSLITTLTVGGGVVGRCLAMHPSGRFLYIAGASLVAVDPQTGSVVRSGLGGCSLAIDPRGTLLYLETFTSILVLDTTNLQVVGRIELPGECQISPPNLFPVGCPYQLAMHPSGAFLYVTHRHDPAMSVVDTTSRSVVATVPIGTIPDLPSVSLIGYPGLLAVHPSGSRVYATTFDPNLHSGGGVSPTTSAICCVGSSCPSPSRAGPSRVSSSDCSRPVGA